MMKDGVQSYTLREPLKRDFEGTMEQVAAIGYREVELHDYFGRTPEQIRALLDRLGMTSPSAHLPLATAREKLDEALDAARVIGHEFLLVAWIEEPMRTAAGYRELAAELDRFGAASRERGIRFAYHNHDFDFHPVENGRSGMDILFAGTDPARVEFELDLYWAVRAGFDPVRIIDQHPGRFPLWHVKDMADRAGSQRMADVGTGEIDFRRIFARAETAGLRHFFVEHDEPADPITSIRTSFQNLQRILS